MKRSLLLLSISLLFIACSQKPHILFESLPKTYLYPVTFAELPAFEKENYEEVLSGFLNNCRTKKTEKIYASLCKEAAHTLDAKRFILQSFTPYMITQEDAQKEGLLTGYYEAALFASKKKSAQYPYPIYKTPEDLLSIDLSSIYPELKKYRLRGRLEGKRVVPYQTRKESKAEGVNAEVICYTNSKIDRFFLEIQGSGRVTLDDGTTMFIGYDNQNGHKYSAIGRYLVKIGALRLEDVSLQSIKAWLQANPSRIDEVLNYNKSLVYFRERKKGATGALGLALSARRSVAVDRSFIPLGSMLYMSAKVADKEESRVVFAQDTGGAIKGAIRADLFLGSGDEAMQIAGELKSKLQLWILMPKREVSYE
jgi:membrane-bound lytic murein transglycosylase A